MSEPVTTVAELVRKYGTKTISLTVARLIQLAPEFKGDIELARELGVMMADLESALQDASPLRCSRPGCGCCK